MLSFIPSSEKELQRTYMGARIRKVKGHKKFLVPSKGSWCKLDLILASELCQTVGLEVCKI
jgi:hypothetical protein